jgi:hypothetical protein
MRLKATEVERVCSVRVIDCSFGRDGDKAVQVVPVMPFLQPGTIGCRTNRAGFNSTLLILNNSITKNRLHWLLKFGLA